MVDIRDRMPVILATRDYARWLGERGHLRKNPGMNSVMTLGVVLAVFRFDAAVAQEGYLGQDHDKWHHSATVEACQGQEAKSMGQTLVSSQWVVK